MAHYTVLIKSNAVAGQEAEYERWYNGIHLGEVLAVPGFISGQQFRTPPGANGEKPSHSHSALFAVESDDIDATLAGLGEEFASGNMTLTDALDTGTTPETVVYEPTGDEQHSA